MVQISDTGNNHNHHELRELLVMDDFSSAEEESTTYIQEFGNVETELTLPLCNWTWNIWCKSYVKWWSILDIHSTGWNWSHS